MKPYDNDDELDRALFALTLEEPPAGMREAILARTIYREPFAVKPWEIWTAGATLAFMTWLVIMLLRGAGVSLVEDAFTYVSQAVEALAQPQVLFWIALGGAATFWISQLNLIVAPGVQRTARR